MTIGVAYRSYLQEKVIKDFLYQGIIPTKSQIDEKLESYELKNQGLNNPFTQPDVYKLAESDKSSAGKVNTTMGTIYNDLSVLYTALTEQASTVTRTFDSITTELNLIKKKTSELEAKASNLLFLAPQSEGMIDYVSDSFTDRLKIDDDRTSVFIDTASGKVSLAAQKFNRAVLSLSDSDVQFNVITKNDFLSAELAPNSSMLYAFDDSDSIWSHRVKMRRGVGSVTAELLLRIPNAGQEINKVIVIPAASDEGNIATVSVQYSNDGLNWSNVSGEDSARLIGDTSLTFNSVTATYWKFLFNKAGYDEYVQDSYLYEFAAKSIQLYGVEYSNKDNLLEGTLVSNALIPATDKPFNRVSLSVCEKIPENCTIQYFIAGLSPAMLSQYEAGTLDWNSIPFIPVDPQERVNKANQSFIDYAKLDLEEGFTSTHQVDGGVDFRYKNRANLALNFTVDTSHVKDQIKILRNIGSNSSATQVLTEDKGWRTDGTYYSTEFYVSANSGFTINLGNTTATLDGDTVTGRITIAKGYHKFSTHRDNWRKLNPNNITATSSSDPLYPYNHKYLIEGMGDTLYGSDLTLTVGGIPKKQIVDPDSIYAGVDLYWAKSMEEITNFDFTSNVDNDNFDVFTFLKDSNGVERIIVKHTDEPGLMGDENFAIITRSVNGDLQKAVLFKAVFSSQDSKLTPILDEYIIKLGY